MAPPHSGRRGRRAPEDTDPMLADSDSDTAYEDDDRFDEGKTSAELRREDQSLLEEEEEREKLIARSSSAGSARKGGLGRLFRGRDGDTSRRKSKMEPGRDRRRYLHSSEESGLMYDTEEGGRLSSASSRDSSEADEERLRALLGKKKRSSRPLLLRTIIYVFIVILFFILLFAAYRASGLRPTKHYATMLSNGSATFAPTTILISLDGFRADFLQRNLTPTMQSFIDQGVSPPYMNPSFPSVTFPNHWTLATGLYPEAHGIVGNTFWDPEFEQDFYYTHIEVSMQSKWWGGNPLWATAESQGIRTAVHMWPGSEAHVGEYEPAHLDKYNGSEKLSVKVDRILGFLDLPGPDSPHALGDQPRPQLIAAYVPNVDADGHRYGPNSTEIRGTITAVDTMLGNLFKGLEDRNLTNIVNVVIVSDHGMATTDISRLIQLEDLIDPSLIEHIDGWPLYGLWPKNPDNLDRLYQELKLKAEHNPNIEVYLRDFNMPERYHFASNSRIAPLWIVPKAGWAIVTKDEFDVEQGLQTGAAYQPHGLHGYDHEHPLMRAIFLARGPAFPHQPGSRLEPFQNIQLYNIICDSLGIEPAPNNGTLRLPLKPVGLHSDVEPEESPADPPAPAAETTTLAGHVLSSTPSAPSSSPSATAAQSSVAAAASSAAAATTTAPAPSNEETSEGGDDEGKSDGDDGEGKKGDEEEKEEKMSWWEWFTDKVNSAKGWAVDVANKAGDKIEEVKEKVKGDKGEEEKGESP
ncbi:Type I phosphodiesterase/nucleotide pyrophosphatase/phosphate transferase [Lasiodiplodia theobromae]|uniref:Type I phosphodiesterase/nucleotide pyrophosphatase/phosphate transferase n=1 Tax=Lasiodiplodia theobromae TaxID=45133 RepID=UPI0015C3E3C7|nr:Type I phosphodiesterase/nucleotide pyrophosphatase/phosphate transferase [Lasiodiplodia theobromae]KAF4537122.1 Type I phosphodiesterase/nucleotide pyrophosphatase/phosphate transferase [Lasiodiplodia theobromae]